MGSDQSMRLASAPAKQEGECIEAMRPELSLDEYLTQYIRTGHVANGYAARRPIQKA